MSTLNINELYETMYQKNINRLSKFDDIHKCIHNKIKYNAKYEKTYCFYQIPEFIIGVILMMVFATKLGWFPSSSILLPGESILGSPKILVLPTLTITGALFAYILRMARANVIEVMESNYVRTAILKGLSMRQVVFKHVLPNAMIPTITVIANNVGWMFGGIIVVEFVFAYPGIGSLLIMAIDTRDMRLLQSTALVIAAIYAFANLAADLLYGLLNPRVRVGQ